MKLKIATLVALLVAGHSWADQLGIYTFTGAAGSEATYPVDSQPANATFSAMSRGSGVTGSAGANTFAATQWSLGALDANDYFEFTITADGGYAVTLTNLAFQERRSNTGIRDWSLRSSLDGYTADIATNNVPDNDSDRNHSVPLDGSFADLASVTFRLYGYNAEAAGGTWRIDNVALSGSIDPSGPPPTNVHFTVASQTVNEGAGSVSVTVVKTLPSGNVSGSVTLGGTATLGTDYTIDTTNFVMNGATTSATFTVTIIDDEDEESSETITLDLANVIGAGIASPDQTVITITDNDAEIPEQGEVVYYTGFEDGSKGSYAAGNVTLSNVVWTFDEAVIGTLAGDRKNGSKSARLRTNDIATIEMQQDISGGVGVVSFLYAKYGSDGDGALTLEYSLDSGSSWLDAGSVAVETTDLTLYATNINQAGDIRFRVRKTSGSATTRANVDDFTVYSLGGEPPPPGTNVHFAVASASAGEDAGTYTVTVVKTLPSGNVSGSVTLGGTATLGAGNDYTINTTNFTMNGATTSATFTITINDDAEVEGPETITLTLANVTGAGAVTPSTFTLTINDNDTPPETPEGIAAFRFTDGSLAVSTKDANISVSDMALSAGTIETNVTAGTYFPNKPYIEETGGWNQPSQALAKNFSFTITPDSGYMVTVTGVSFRAYATGVGPSGIGYDVGGGMATFAMDAPDSSLVVVSNAVTGVDNQAGAITVMIQGWTNGSRATSGGGILKIDDVVVFGTVSSAGPVPPVLNPIGNKSVAAGVPLGFAVTATPTDGDPVTLTVSNAPVGSTFGSTNASGYFSWANPGPAGVYTVSFYASDKDGADSEQISITVTSPPAPIQTNLWINEIHYDNQGADVDEGFEIAGPAGTDLNGYNVYLYDYNSGSVVYSNIALSGVIPDEGQGFGALWFAPDAGANGALFNGPDGLALVYGGSVVLQFISYEGVITAVNGPAQGLTSTDIGLRETNTGTPVGYSLQVCGTGNTASDFAWTPGPTDDWRLATPGLLNDCQTIDGGGSGYSQEQEDWIVANWGDVGSYPGDELDSDGDGSPNIEEFIAGTDPVPPNGANSYFEVIRVPGAGATVPTVIGRVYRLWTIPSLRGSQTWTQVGNGTEGTGTPLQLNAGTTTNSAAFRVTVEMAAP